MLLNRNSWTKKFSQFPRRIEIDVDRCPTVLEVQFELRAISEKTPEREVGPESIDMDVNPAAGAKDTVYFTDHLLRFAGVHQNTVRINVIKAFIFERKMTHIGMMDGCEATDAFARQLYVFGG